MIAVDTCVIMNFFQGKSSDTNQHFRDALHNNAVVLPPVVLSELLSYVHPSKDIENSLIALPLLDITSGFWQRLGYTRRTLLQKGRKSRIGDAMIAQGCIDHNVPLLTEDSDFSPYAIYASLKLVT